TGDDVVERDALRAAGDDADLQVILQIIADAGGIQHDIDAVAFEQVGRPDAGELQQLRRIVGAARHQDFAAGPNVPQLAALPVFHAARAAAFEQDALSERIGLDVKV